MTVDEFREEIKHLDQVEVLTGGLDSLNRLLVEKGIVTQNEIQEHFLEWLDLHDALQKVKFPDWRTRFAESASKKNKD